MAWVEVWIDGCSGCPKKLDGAAWIKVAMHAVVIMEHRNHRFSQEDTPGQGAWLYSSIRTSTLESAQVDPVVYNWRAHKIRLEIGKRKCVAWLCVQWFTERRTYPLRKFLKIEMYSTAEGLSFVKVQKRLEVFGCQQIQDKMVWKKLFQLVIFSSIWLCYTIFFLRWKFLLVVFHLVS